MTNSIKKVGFGGGCHWCTEAVFQHVDGVVKVEQGWISSDAPNEEFSEAVIVHYDGAIEITELISIHLQTHSSSSAHALRKKYRSAIYFFDEISKQRSKTYLQTMAGSNIITKVLPFREFKENEEKYRDYYLKNPERPFCQRYIKPKIERIKRDKNITFK